MEFRIAKTEFLRGLRLAQGIADRKSTMPMLANVLLRTQGKNQLLVAATDLNVSLTAELKSNNASDGGITLGAKNLYELIANAPGDEISLKKADNHWAEIKSGKVTYRIVGMPARDFPKVPDHREATYATIESAVLREMIERTLFSICNDETRFHLNVVFFESDGSKARMVSTDGHRLSKVERTIASGPKLSAGVIIPKKGLLEIRKVLEQQELGVGGRVHGVLTAGADVGVQPAQFELVDDGDRTHLVIGGHLGVEVDPPQLIWPRCARLTRTSRSGCTRQLAPAAPAGSSAAPAHNAGWVADPVRGAGRLRLTAPLACPCVAARSGPAATPRRVPRRTSTDRRSRGSRSRRARRRACARWKGRSGSRGGPRSAYAAGARDNDRRTRGLRAASSG